MKEGCIDKKDAHGAKLFGETAFFCLYGIGTVDREGGLIRNAILSKSPEIKLFDQTVFTEDF